MKSILECFRHATVPKTVPVWSRTEPAYGAESYSALVMLTEDELQHFDKFVTGVARWVGSRPAPQNYCSLEALTRDELPLFCLIRAGASGPKKCEVLDYGSIQLRRDIFPADQLPERLAKLNEQGGFPGEAGKIAFGSKCGRPYQTFHPSQSVYSSWPGHLFEIGPIDRPNSYSRPEPLVGRNLPPFFDAKDAIQNWTGVPVSDSDNRFHEILLFLPDFTARLGGLTFKDGRLRVTSEFAPSESLDISVLATDGNTTFRKTNSLRKSQVFRIMTNPTSISVFITESRGRILDRFDEDQISTTRERVIFAGVDYSRSLVESIRQGESDTVEFKTFINLEDKKKAAEIVKAVISFANSAGGTLYIGVNDDAEIEGIEAHVPHDSRRAREFQSDYFAGIRRLLQQKLNRIPTIRISAEKIGDKTAFLIRIKEGSAKPYFNVQTGEIFIRRGASDVRPNPDKDLRLMFNSTEGVGIGAYFGDH